MDKIQVIIDPQDWGNLITKYQPYSKQLSAGDFTRGTINVDTDTNGSVIKRKGGPNYNSILLSAAPKDQFEAIFSDGARHLLVVANGTFSYSSGDTLFNSVVNGSGFSVGANFEFATTQDRVYGSNKVNPPQVYDRITSYGGVSYSAPRLKVMGAQAPASAPTLAVAAGGSVPVGAHTYKITFLYYDAEESNGGPVSSVATTTAGNQTINLTAIPVGGYGVTARKIYRDNNDGNWVFVHEVTDNTTTTFSDTIAVSVTPTPIPTDNFTPPTFGLVSLWLSRLWVSQVPGDPNVLFYSEADQPDIFGSENQVLCNSEDPITATIVYFDRLIVLNRRSLGQIVGSTPDNFRYAAIPSSVGCVDNRTLQIHVLHGVPVLIWLSERGFYIYDGNSINYLSDQIEDLVNYNIQQATQQKNANAQTSFTGTADDGIDSTQLASIITSKGYLNGQAVAGNNPRRNWNTTPDWETAAPLNGAWTPNANTNTRTKDGDNSLRVPDAFGTSGQTGTFSGMRYDTTVSPPGLKLITTPSQFIPSVGDDGTKSLVFAASGGTVTFPFGVGKQFTVPTAGTLTFMGATFYQSPNAALIVQMQLYSDSSGAPGTLLQTSSNQTLIQGTGTSSLNFFFNRTLGAGNFWMFMVVTNNPNVQYGMGVRTTGTASPTSFFHDGTFTPVPNSFPGGATVVNIPMSFNFTQTPVPNSGSFLSPVNDSKSIFVGTGMSVLQTLQNAGQGTTTTTIEGSDTVDFSSGIQSSAVVTNLNGTASIGTSGRRYWRIRVQMSTNDNRFTPVIQNVTVKFNQVGTFESETIDTSGQSTVYNSLVTSFTLEGGVPANGTVVTTIATSASTTGPWTYVAFGSHTVRRYVRIKVTITNNTGSFSSPIVSSVVFTWTLMPTYSSVVIDTAAVPPAGWDVFLAQYTANGGVVSFQMRSAASLIALASATYYAVNPGDFPNLVPIFQYAQWKVTITSADNQVPVVDAVTVQWFTASGTSVRPASIFVNGRYYVALAELSQTTNNLIIELDLKGKWRRLSGLTIATFSFFFNNPYFGLSTSGQIRKFLEGFTDAGSAIEFDLRTKAFDYSTPYKDISDKFKVVGELIIHMDNTGAGIQVFYSVDNGRTFFPMYVLDGSTTYQTTSDGTDVYVRFKPSWTNGNPIAGRYLMYRIYNNDINQVQIHGMKAAALVREQPPVITG